MTQCEGTARAGFTSARDDAKHVRTAAMRPDDTYHPALDGVRALAVVAVLLFHGEISGAPGGFLGVSTFFTLSGFLITRLLLTELARTGTVDLRHFWTRRFRRLMPASLLGLAVVLALAHLTSDPAALGRLRGDVLAALAYVSNWRFMQTAESYFAIFEDPSPVQHFWSLSIEEQFYLLYPLTVLALWRRRPDLGRGLALPIAVLAIAGAAAGVILTTRGASQARVYYGTDTRAPELLIGALLALWMARRERLAPARVATEITAALALLGSIAAVVLVHEGSPVLDRGGFAAYAVMTAVLLHGAMRPSVVARVLAFAPLRRLGRISYGVYVYHWPVFLWLDAERTGLGLWPLFGVRVAVTLAAAIGSFALVEWPIRTGRRLLAWRLWASAAGAALCLVAGTLWVTRHATASIDIVAILDDLSLAAAPIVTVTDGRTPLRVLLVGDSVVGDLGTGLVRWGEETDTPLAVWNLGRSACAIGRGGRKPTVEGFVQLKDHCATWPQLWAAAVEKFDPDVVVVHTGPLELVDRERPEWGRVLAPGAAEFDAWLVSEFQVAVDVLTARGARLVWLTTPCTGPAGPRVPLFAIGSLDPRRILHFNHVILPTLAASRPTTVRLFDLYSQSCPKGRFSETIPGTRTRLRKDHLHYTGGGATWIAATLGPVVAEDAWRRHPS